MVDRIGEKNKIYPIRSRLYLGWGQSTGDIAVSAGSFGMGSITSQPSAWAWACAQHGHVHSMGMGMAWAWARSRYLAKEGVTVGGHMSAPLGAHVAEHLLAPGGS